MGRSPVELEGTWKRIALKKLKKVVTGSEVEMNVREGQKGSECGKTWGDTFSVAKRNLRQGEGEVHHPGGGHVKMWR